MRQYKLKKGLDLPVQGAPAQEVRSNGNVATFGVLGADFVGLKPRLAVNEGDVVGAGAPIFAHKDTPTAFVTAPVSGRIKAVNRGARRALISVEIERDDAVAEPVDFSKTGDVSTSAGLAERLAAAGLWTSFRTRPYSKVPDPESRPAAIFVTAMDTEPLSPDPEGIIRDDADAFVTGLEAMTQLSDGQVYLCHADGADLPGGDVAGVTAAAFSGPHPAGLAGTHVHFLEPPTASKVVWTIGYQDIIAVGRLLKTGHYDPTRVIAVTGPLCANPRLERVRMGASMVELTKGDLSGEAPVRMISGSILSGRMAHGADAYIGRYARQITLIEEDHKQIPMGWIRPMPSKFAFQPVLGSALSQKLYALTSNLNGGRRAMVPLGTFEQLMPQDYMATQLLRSLLVMDTDQAQLLGVLELDEEDLGLVTFACPAKYEYGIALRDCLTKIEKEG